MGGINLKYIAIVVVLAILSVSCGSDETTSVESDTLNIGIPRDPAKLNPLFNPNVIGREIFQNIYLSCADFDPESLELIPVLITEIPKTTRVGDTLVIPMELKPEAVWSDGQPMTGHDYAFAVKAGKHPDVQSAAWKPYLQFVYDVKVDANNRKQFTVMADANAMAAKETVLTFYPLPKHVYDVNGHSDAFAVSDLLNDETIAKVSTSEAYKTFATELNNPDNYRTNIVHAGPYTLVEWQSDQYVKLAKQPDYWGEAYGGNPYLQTGMDTLVFKIVKDKVTMLSMLNNGSLDLVKHLNAMNFVGLQSKDSLAHRFDFYTTPSSSLIYLAINNCSDKLVDKRVRRALLHSIDVKTIIDQLEYGMGQQIAVLTNPNKPYYPKGIKPVKLNATAATNLLNQAGWKDTNANGTVDNAGVEMELDMYVSGSELGTAIALSLKEAAEQVGIGINVHNKPPRTYIKENVKKKNYDLAGLKSTVGPSSTDPYPRWHSDNANDGGSNIFCVKNTEADSLIALIRHEEDSDARNANLQQFWSLIYDQSPVIPLYNPLEKIVVKSDYTGVVTSKRPHYMANTFRKK